MRVAIMQPYFMPYAGYFRLMEAADLFVAYDCVQFPRRGWVHRNKLTHKNGQAEWLTLPLAKGDRDSTRIMDLSYAENHAPEWHQRMGDFPALASDHGLMHQVRNLGTSPRDYLVSGLKAVCQELGIQCAFANSEPLALGPEVTGQNRILAIAKHYGATEYINAPGGVDLYDATAFAENGIKLKFLESHDGPYTSILERVLTEPAETIADEIKRNCRFQA